MITRALDIAQRHPWITACGLVLLLAIVGTAGLRETALWRVEQNEEVLRSERVQEALDVAEARFTSLRDQAYARARRLATDSTVITGLRDADESGRPSSALYRHVVERSTEGRTSVEVYGPELELLVWNGERVPRRESHSGDSTVDTSYSQIVADGATRHALVVVVPVRDGQNYIGSVRVARILRSQPPVQNRYIQAFDVIDQWEREAGESFQVAWGDDGPASDDPHRALRGLNGQTLGYVTVQPPSSAQLVRRTVRYYDDVLALWGILFLGWVVGISVFWYARLARRSGSSRFFPARRGAAGRFFCAALLWVGVRYALLWMDVPGRWAVRNSLGSGFFDPTHLASTVGGGLFRSIGDLFLTSGWSVVLAIGLVHLALLYRFQADSLSNLIGRIRTHRPERPSPTRFLILLTVGLGGGLVGVVGLAVIVRRIVLDSTLDFFARAGLLPEPLVFAVLGSLFLLVIAVILAGIAGVWIGLRLLLRYRPVAWSPDVGKAILGLFTAVGVVLLVGMSSMRALVPISYSLLLPGVVLCGAVYGLVARRGGTNALSVLGLLGSLFVITLAVYPLLYVGMDTQRRERMAGAARSFEEGYNPHVLYALQQGLRSVEEGLDEPSTAAAPDVVAKMDSIGTRLVRRSLLATQTSYEVSVSLFAADGTFLHRYATLQEGSRSPTARPAERRAYDALRRLYDLQPEPGPVVDRFIEGYGGSQSTDRFQYGGLVAVRPDRERVTHYILVRAEPRSLLPGTGSGVPRVLLPDGSYGDLYAEVSLAEFRAGTLVRSYGRGFDRTQLPASRARELAAEERLWTYERVHGRRYLTLYSGSDRGRGDAGSTIAARIPAIGAFDHLYYLLRLTVAGLGIGLVFYIAGLFARYRYGIIPASRVRFRDKVLNAFLVVGTVSVGAVGIAGVQVVTGEDDRIIERQLREQLGRVEETLALEAQRNEPLWKTAARVDVDSLAARVGVELRVFEEGRLVGTSRPRLVRDGLVADRLPGDVYVRIYHEGYGFTTSEATIGTFPYRVGYQVLSDNEGTPRLVVGVPTLAQQEHLQQEQARTLAYLFGALLLLIVIVMATAIVLANALAKPLVRLRERLEAVGKGRYAEPLAVDTRDEIGDLVRAFNTMRERLAESRRKLAQQERELAWREMARQVAHEIKNPLTPMKLSIQHLRRTFKEEEPATPSSRFAEAFDRITKTLIDQIESLVRIADEFSTFARLPTRVSEPVDVNEVVQEAADLIAEDSDKDGIYLDLYPDPLVVEADREELRRIYINLLKNARQSIPDERTVRISVSTTVDASEADDPVVVTKVVDNGTGIPSDLREKIFEPNFSTKTSGTGLGLAIAQKAIDELGGDIGFETTEGQGTTFWVRLPLAERPAGADA